MKRKNSNYKNISRLIGITLLALLSSGAGACRVSQDCDALDPACDPLMGTALYGLLTEPIVWNTFLGGTGNEMSHTLVQTADGGYLVAAYSNASFGQPLSPHSGGQDALFARYDFRGNRIWHTFIGVSGGTIFISDIITTRDGGYLALGYSDVTFGSPLAAFSGGEDALVIKLDDAGNLLWHTFVGGTALDRGVRSLETTDGDFLLIIESEGTFGTPLQAHNGSKDMALVRLSSEGTLRWNTFYGGTAIEVPRSISPLSDGNYLIGGWVNGVFDLGKYGSPVAAHVGGKDYGLLKVSPEGALLWHTFLGSAGEEGLATAFEMPGGEIIATGNGDTSFGSPRKAYTGGADILTARFSGSGALLWHSFSGGSGDEYPGFAIPRPGQGLLLVGSGSAGFASPLNAFPDGAASSLLAAAFDDQGNLTWHTFFGGGTTFGSNASPADDGGFTLIGGSDSSFGAPLNPHSGGDDVLLVKVRPDGSF